MLPGMPPARSVAASPTIPSRHHPPVSASVCRCCPGALVTSTIAEMIWGLVQPLAQVTTLPPRLRCPHEPRTSATASSESGVRAARASSTHVRFEQHDAEVSSLIEQLQRGQESGEPEAHYAGGGIDVVREDQRGAASGPWTTSATNGVRSAQSGPLRTE